MKKEVISKKQMQMLIFTYPLGVYLLFGEGSDLKQDAWIASIMAILISIVILKMYEKLMGLYPGKNLYDILEIVFGKFFGKLLNVIFTCHGILLSTFILNNFIDFINLTALWETPKIIPMVIISILIIWMLKKGINTLVSWTKINMILIFVAIILAYLFIIPNMDISNLQPVFDHSFKDIFKSGLSISMIAFMEVFIFLGFFDSLEDPDLKNIFIKPLTISGILLTFIMIINLMLVGGNEYSTFYYPGYEAIKKMRLAGEFQRFEVVVSVLFTMVRIMELSFSVLTSAKGLERLFNLNNYRDVLVPVVFIILNLAYIIFNSIMDATDFLRDMWTLYSFLLHVALPGLVFIGVIIKRKVLKPPLINNR